MKGLKPLLLVEVRRKGESRRRRRTAAGGQTVKRVERLHLVILFLGATKEHKTKLEIRALNEVKCCQYCHEKFM